MVNAYHAITFLFPLHDLGNLLRGIAQGLFALILGHGVIGIEAGDIADGGVALDGEVFLKVLHREDGDGRVRDAPDDDGADDDRVAQGVVDLLLLVVQGAGLEGNLLGLAEGDGGLHAGGGDLLHGLRRLAVHDGGGVGGDEWVDRIEARGAQGAVILTKEGQHQRLVRADDLVRRKADAKGDEGEGAGDQQKDAGENGTGLHAHAAENHRGDGNEKAEDVEDQREEAVYRRGDLFLRDGGREDFGFHAMHTP